jgi:Ca-activated chloride channel family protein
VTTFRFQNPWVLALLIPLVIGALLARRRRQPTVLYSSVELLHDLPQTWAQICKRSLPHLRFFGFALAVVALARPQLGEEEFRVRTEGIAIEMCLDRSGSMLALDFSNATHRLTRLDAVKNAFRDFVVGTDGLAGRPDDLIGLIVFGGFADAKCPHTLDHGTLLEILESTEVARPVYDRQGNVINEDLWQEEQSTAIGDAVALAVDRLRGVDSKTKVAILLSDGENTSGVISPAEAAVVAKEFGVKIYAIGVGHDGMAPFETRDVFGRTRLESRRVAMDEETLKMLADTTGGQYFHAENAEALQRVYEEIDKLEKTESEGLVFARYRERCQIALLPAIALLLAETVLSSTRFRTLP